MLSHLFHYFPELIIIVDHHFPHETAKHRRSLLERCDRGEGSLAGHSALLEDGRGSLPFYARKVMEIHHGFPRKQSTFTGGYISSKPILQISGKCREFLWEILGKSWENETYETSQPSQGPK